MKDKDTFAEDFPEFEKVKRHQVRIPFLDGGTIATHAREEVHIEEHTRSVSKIRKAIDKVFPDNGDGVNLRWTYGSSPKEYLLKELGCSPNPEVKK